MSTSAPAQLVLVLRGVIGEGAGATRKWFRDDNFLNNWVLVSADGTLATDSIHKDIGTLTNGATSAAVFKNTFFGTLLTNDFPRVIWRARNVTTTSAILRIKYTDATEQSFNIIAATAFTLRDNALTAGKTILEIRIENGATGSGNSSEWDFVVLAKDTVLDITKHVKALSVDDALRGRMKASLIVNNDNARYWTSPNRINQSDILLVWGDDTEAPSVGFGAAQKRFGGKITGLKQRASKTGPPDKTLAITARGWGLGLEKTTISITSQTEFFGLSDQAFVEKVIDKANSNGWNFAKMTSGSPTTIQDTLSVTVLDWIPERQPALKILEAFSDWLSARRDSTVDLPDGTQERGCDFRVLPSEVFEWGVIDNFFTLDGTTRTQADDFAEVDIEEITDHLVNAVYWLGRIAYPLEPDKFTENDSANWSTHSGFSNTFSDSVTFKVGAKAIQVNTSGGAGTRTVRRPLPNTISRKIVSSPLPPEVFAYLRRDNAGITAISMGIIGNAGPVSFLNEISPEPNVIEWLPSTVAVGDSLGSSFDIDYVGIKFTASGVGQNLLIDGLEFRSPYLELAYDQASINSHTRAEIFIIDRAIRDVKEIRRFARGALRKWRDVIFQGTLKFSGIYDVRPGDRLDATITDLNQTTKRYRILSISHQLMSPATTTIEVTTHTATLDAPRGKPSLFQMMTGRGMHAPKAFEDVELRLQQVIRSMPANETEIATAI